MLGGKLGHSVSPRSEPRHELVQNVQAVQAVQSLSLVLPRDAGEETGGGLIDLNYLNESNSANIALLAAIGEAYSSDAIS
jgi:hypothetical protein